MMSYYWLSYLNSVTLGMRRSKGSIKVANYTPTTLKGKHLTWTLTNSQDQVIAQNNIPLQINQGTLAEVGPLNIALPAIQEAETYTLRLAIEGTDYHNHYPLWIYPEHNNVQIPTDINVIKKWDKQAENLLANGAKVLWFPDAKDLQERDGRRIIPDRLLELPDV